MIEQEAPIVVEKEGKWTTLLVDSQLLSAFMKCPRYFHYRFNRHLVPVGGPGPSLNKGILTHYGLAKYYDNFKEKMDWKNSAHLALKDTRAKAPELDLGADDCLLVYRTLEEYFDYRKNDIFEVLGTEIVFRKIIYEEFPLRVVTTGRIDLVTREFQSSITIPYDHKSEAQAWYYSATSNQFKIYALACDSPKLIVNRIGFQKSKTIQERFKRDEIFFAPGVLDEFRNVIVPYYAQKLLIAWSEDFFEPNYSACIQGNFGCMFSDKNAGVCTESPDMREQIIQVKFREEEWNPEFEG